MCSIFGVALFKGHKIADFEMLHEIISRLAVAALPGGSRASGVSIMQERNVTVLRAPIPSSDLVDTEAYKNALAKHVILEPPNRFVSLIGHCRLNTKGCPSNNKNNHPIVIDNITGVHNGMIGNDDALFAEYEGIINRIAEVDTEIIFQLIEMFVAKQFEDKKSYATVPAIKATAGLLQGSYACALHNAKKPYHLYLFRSGNPTSIRIYPDTGLLLFATREYYIDDAVEDAEGLGSFHEIDLLPRYGVVFNLHEKTMYKFSLGSQQVSRRHENA